MAHGKWIPHLKIKQTRTQRPTGSTDKAAGFCRKERHRHRKHCSPTHSCAISSEGRAVVMQTNKQSAASSRANKRLYVCLLPMMQSVLSDKICLYYTPWGDICQGSSRTSGAMHDIGTYGKNPKELKPSDIETAFTPAAFRLQPERIPVSTKSRAEQLFMGFRPTAAQGV